jgi:sulfur carrier protein
MRAVNGFCALNEMSANPKGPEKMVVVINGKQEELTESISIGAFLVRKKLDFDTVVIEHNRRIINKEDFHKFVMKENDSLEVLQFVGGG